MERIESGKNLAVVGAHWGDEGKGKIVDILSADFDVVARYQGGHNAGHTIRLGGRQFILHLVPSGIFRPGMRCIVGNGVVVDPRALLDEIEMLTAAGVSLEGRLFVSSRCHLILPYHRTVEAAIEAGLGERKIGTTSRGIGPAYEDKMSRRGLRIADLMNPEALAERIAERVADKNCILQALGSAECMDPGPVAAAYQDYATRLRPFFADTTHMLNGLLAEGRRVLFEGAQAALLDVDHGTYPFVTSSNSTATGIPAGLGIAPKYVHHVLGVMKAYATRVGAGPFPTEVDGPLGDQIRERGAEYGSTTRRPRRCGWFDGPAARYAAMINGMDSLAVTKVDVLDALEEIPFCTGYRYKGSLLEEFPADADVLAAVEPVYTRLPGWNTSIAGRREWSDLPERTRDYLKFLSDYMERPLRFVSTGADREDTIEL